MGDIGYPVSTNRSGAWFRRTSGSSPAVAPRVDHSKPNHLSEVLRPLKEKGLLLIGLTGLDSSAEKLRDLTNGDQEHMDRLGRAIDDAIIASTRTHPHFIGRDPSEHDISEGELKRRIEWCINIAQILRFDFGKSFTHICNKLPLHLGDWLDGTFWGKFEDSAKRTMYATKQLPRGLRPDPSDET